MKREKCEKTVMRKKGEKSEKRKTGKEGEKGKRERSGEGAPPFRLGLVTVALQLEPWLCFFKCILKRIKINNNQVNILKIIIL